LFYLCKCNKMIVFVRRQLITLIGSLIDIFESSCAYELVQLNWFLLLYTEHWSIYCNYTQGSEKFSNFAVSIQGNDIPSISLLRTYELVIMIFHGKFNHYNSLLRNPLEVTNMYSIGVCGYYIYPCYLLVAGDYLFCLEYISTAKTLGAQFDVTMLGDP